MIEDLSAFVICGRVRAQPGEGFDTSARTPRQGIEDGVDVERLGFHRAFLSERWNLKEAGVLLGAIGARTEHIGLGTGVLPPAARHPLHAAAFGSTMQASFGPRFILGLGRGDESWSIGLEGSTFKGLEDYVDIVRRLWRGETVDYDGPAGDYTGLALRDTHDGPDPEVWFGTLGLPRGAAVTAACMDGVLLVPNMTPDATAASVQRIHEACERIGRDPAEVRIGQCVITAPDLDEAEMRQICHARAVTYLECPGYGQALTGLNGWDPAVIERLAEHRQFQEGQLIADQAFHRVDLTEPAKLVPDEWMYDSCAIGTVDECVDSLQRFRDAGADEIITYGSTPAQNANLAAAWSARRTAPTTPSVAGHQR